MWNQKKIFHQHKNFFSTFVAFCDFFDLQSNCRVHDNKPLLVLTFPRNMVCTNQSTAVFCYECHLSLVLRHKPACRRRTCMYWCGSWSDIISTRPPYERKSFRIKSRPPSLMSCFTYLRTAIDSPLLLQTSYCITFNVITANIKQKIIKATFSSFLLQNRLQVLDKYGLLLHETHKVKACYICN